MKQEYVFDMKEACIKPLEKEGEEPRNKHDHIPPSLACAICQQLV